MVSDMYNLERNNTVSRDYSTEISNKTQSLKTRRPL